MTAPNKDSKNLFSGLFEETLLKTLLMIEEYGHIYLISHPLYVTFDPAFKGVKLPIGAKVGEGTEVTISLHYSFEQSHFKDLVINDDSFSVSLYFQEGFKKIEIPFGSVLSFDFIGVQTVVRKSDTQKVEKEVLDAVIYVLLKFIAKAEYAYQKKNANSTIILNFEEMKR